MKVEELTRYKVILSGEILDGMDRAVVIERLSNLFHSKPAYVKRLLAGKEVPLKKEYGKKEATRICLAIRNAGAQCKLTPVQEPELAISTHDDLPLAKEEEQIRKEVSNTDVAETELDNSISVVETTKKHGTEEKYTVDRKLADFVGPNQSYYLKVFGNMGSVEQPRFAWSWNWPAFLAFFIWSLYRKLWLWAGVYLIGMVIMSKVSVSLALMVAYSVLWAVMANYLYFRHAAKHILQPSPLADSDNQRRFLQNSGGVSRIGMWLGIGISVWMTVYSSQQVVKEIITHYESQYGESVQRRGDGTELVLSGSFQGELGRTSKALTILATAFKAVAVTGNVETINQTIQMLSKKSADGQFIDGWGNTIEIVHDPGKVVFSSSGPDGVAGTADDILQTVQY